MLYFIRERKSSLTSWRFLRTFTRSYRQKSNKIFKFYRNLYFAWLFLTAKCYIFLEKKSYCDFLSRYLRFPSFWAYLICHLKIWTLQERPVLRRTTKVVLKFSTLKENFVSLIELFLLTIFYPRQKFYS